MRLLLFICAPILLAALLLWRRPRYLRIRLRELLIYLVVVCGLIGGALLAVATFASAVLPPLEVAVVGWFTIACRLAWTAWRDAVHRPARYEALRAVRQQRAGEAARLGARLARPAAAALTALVFVPLLLAFVLTHRCKLRDGQDPSSAAGIAFERFRTTTDDGVELDGWFVPQPGATRCIVVCHGAGANKGNFVWFLPPLMYRGYNVVFFDFRAHGASDGRTCTYGLIEQRDVRAVVDWLKRTRPAQAEKIVGLGSSQGAMALALAAASEPRIDAVILDSPYVGPRELAHHHLGRIPLLGPVYASLVLWNMSWMSGADFLETSAETAVASLGKRPALVIHGADDVLMPAAHAQRLYDAARGPKSIWFGPGPHSNIVTTDSDGYAQRVFAFLDEHLGRATNRGR